MATHRLALILVFCSLAGVLRAGAVATANLFITIQFPRATVNEFGFSGPLISTPPPQEDEIPDGRVITAVQAAVNKVQLDPLLLKITAGPIDVETTNDGDATAEVDGALSGRLANLTVAPLTVTFSIGIDAQLKTHNDEEADFAEADAEANFHIGSWSASFTERSIDEFPPTITGFRGGNVAVTIPALSVVNYSVDFSTRGDVSSECTGPACSGPPPVPEPGTLLLGCAGVAALLGRATKSRRRRAVIRLSGFR